MHRTILPKHGLPCIAHILIRPMLDPSLTMHHPVLPMHGLPANAYTNQSSPFIHTKNTACMTLSSPSFSSQQRMAPIEA